MGPGRQLPGVGWWTTPPELQLDPRWHGGRAETRVRVRDEPTTATQPETRPASHLGQKSRWPCLAACVCTGSMAGRLSLLDPPERVGI